jgi:hypothetical protein
MPEAWITALQWSHQMMGVKLALGISLFHENPIDHSAFAVFDLKPSASNAIFDFDANLSGQDGQHHEAITDCVYSVTILAACEASREFADLLHQLEHLLISAAAGDQVAVMRPLANTFCVDHCSSFWL